MASQDFKKLTTDRKFLEWFWREDNGNELIKRLNSYAQQSRESDRIRREKESPHVYAIVLNHFPNADWKLVKVGFTHKSVERDTNNRMEQLRKEIEGVFREVEAPTLFKVPIGSVDTTPFHTTEAQIRAKVGTPLTKEKAKELKLPVHTEWVLTSQRHIYKIIQKVRAGKADKSTKDLIEAFEDIDAPTTPPEEFRDWVE